MADFDVAISGGGMAGATLAVALARQGRKICVIEPVVRDADHQPSYNDRTLVLNAASLNILGNLGLMDGRLQLTPVEEIHVSRQGRAGHVRMRAADHGRQRFGAVVVARELGNVLLDALAESPNIRVLCPDALTGWQPGPGRVLVRLDSGDAITARLLVGADGTGSAVRRLAGIEPRIHDYNQSALVFNARSEQAHGNRAWERFTGHGPVAVLPQPQGRLGVVLIDSRDSIADLVETSDAQILALLHERFGHRLGAFSEPGQRSSYPLVRLQATTGHAQRMVLIGNAATTVHPVSAQGFNLGLRDVAGLVEILEGVGDIGEPGLLEHYNAQRRADRAETIRYTDTLARAFTNPSMPFGLGTRLGLAAHAFFPALERRLAAAAMGFRSPVSRLASREWSPGRRRTS